jgi:putative membrane protein
MTRLLVRLAINALALWAAVTVVPGLEYVGEGGSLFLIALIFGVVNAMVRPLLLFLTCPLIILTLGIFVLVINGIMLSLTIFLAGPELLDLGLSSTGFWATFMGALVISLVSGVMNVFVKDEREREKRRTDRR